MRLAIVAAVFLLSQLMACTSVPQEQLRAFTESFGAADAAARTLYGTLDIAVAKASQGSGSGAASACESRPPAPPTCFDPADVLPAGERPLSPDIEVRILAFEVVGAYNEALLSLASGQTGAALASRVETLGDIAGKAASLGSAATGSALTPVLDGPVAGSLATLAQRAEQARANDAAARSLLAEQEVVWEIIDLLIADTPATYQLYRQSQEIVATNVPGAPLSAESVAEAARIPAFHEALGAYVALLGEARESHKLLIGALDADLVARIDLALDQALEVRAAGAAFAAAVKPLSD